MIDPRNLINIAGGLVADPELVNDGKLLKLRIGVDYAGSPREDEDQTNKSGYFPVIMWLSDDNANTRFVKDQVDKGNFKKGTPLQFVGRIQNDRFKTKDGNNAEQTVIIAESIAYWGRANSERTSTDDEAKASEEAPKPAFKF